MKNRLKIFGFIRLSLLAVYVVLGFLSVSAGRVSFFPNGDEYEPSENATYYPLVIKIYNESEVDSLVDLGCIILRRRGDILLCYQPIPVEDESDDKPKGIRRIASPDKDSKVKFRRNVPSLDIARGMFDASKILTGDGLPQDYKGRGIVVGICDIGFDPMHPTFLDSEGNTRIRRLTQYVEEKGCRYVMDSPEEYAEWGTDSDMDTHATHVAGILSGSRSTEGYQGIASEADIVISTCQLSDVGLLCGAEDILDYAKSVGKPCVINMSMGNYVGPHDGTSLFNQYLDMLGEEAIICLSSGNEGNRYNSLSVAADDDKNGAAYFRLANYRYNNYEMTGYTDIWSDYNKPLYVEVIMYDEQAGKIVYTMPKMKVENGSVYNIVTSEENAVGDDVIVDSEIARYFEGWLDIYGEVWKDNNRMNVMLAYEMVTDKQSSAGAWARYSIAFRITGEDDKLIPGDNLNVYSDGQWTFLKTIPGVSTHQKPSKNMSVSDLATAHNVISVGMYNSRDRVPIIGKDDFIAQSEAGIVNPNSGYGVLADGRVLPLTVAPGSLIISAGSKHYVLNEKVINPDLCGVAKYNGEDYYWKLDLGTSMSSPYVAGFIACWLEANPNLNIRDIQEIIAKSNRHDMPDADNPRHGAGWFDPLAAMKYVLEKLTVDVNDANVVVGQPGISYYRDNVSIDMPYMGRAILYGIDGSCYMSVSGEGKLQFDISSLSEGVYIVKADNEKGNSELKIIKR